MKSPSLHLGSLVVSLALLAFAPKGHADPWAWATYAGIPADFFSGDSGEGYADGTPGQFFSPQGIAVDAQGNAYVADQGNGVVRKISTVGGVATVSTIAGGVGLPGDPSHDTNGAGSDARFYTLGALAVDGNGNVYVGANNTVRKISTAVDGTVTVTTLAGDPSTGGGYSDGSALSAHFNSIGGLAVNADGSVVYVADRNNQLIREISTVGGVATVSTLAGNYGVRGSADGSTGGAAQFRYPSGLALDAHGNLFVADYVNCTIRQISPNPDGVTVTVSTLAGSPTVSGGQDASTGAGATFLNPYGVTVDAVGNVYVADTGNAVIRKISPNGDGFTVTVNTIGGVEGAPGPGDAPGSADGTGQDARFSGPMAIISNGAGKLYVTDGHRVVLGTSLASSAPLALSITGPTTNGAILSFSATSAPDLGVHIQSSSTPADDSSWLNLPDGNGAVMTEGAAGSYSLNSTFYPTGATVSFRAIASHAPTDLMSPPLGPFVLTRAVLSIGVTLASTTDMLAGHISHIGDDLTYKFLVTNNGSATARNLKVVATIPTYQHSDQTIIVTTATGNTTVTMAAGTTANLVLGGEFVGDNQNLPQNATITAITDDTHFVISTPATGSGRGSTLVRYPNSNPQFTIKDLAISPGGTIVPASAPGVHDATITWPMGDLDPNFTQFVSFTVHVSSNVRMQQSLGIGNDYTVYGSTFQPPYSSTGFTSGSPNVGSLIEGPISFTMVPKTSTVAPGGLITYTCTLTNLGSTKVTNAAAFVTEPDSMRYADTYQNPNGTNTVIAGVVWTKTGKVPTPKPILNHWFGSPHPQVVIDAGALYPRGDSLHRDSVSLNVTFQAVWTTPTSVPTLDYGAVFFDPASFLVLNPITGNNVSTTEYAIFKADYAASAGTSAGDPGQTDFFSFIASAPHTLAVSENDSGIVNVALQGSLSEEPQLHLVKQLSSLVTDTEDDGGGVALATAQAGDTLTFVLGASNLGGSEADDVYFEDGLPDHTSFVSAALIGATPSATKSTLVSTLDQLGQDGHHHHIIFEGLHLDALDTVSVQYTVRVDSGAAAPAVGTLLPAEASTIGSSSTPHTPEGVSRDGPIKIVQTLLAQPIVRTLIPRPVVSTDVNATAGALNAFYSRAKTTRNPNPATDVLLTSATDATSYLPGMERYYIHYANTGSAATSGSAVLSFPIPAHTAFYRAAFVTLTANGDKNGIGDMPGKLTAAPPGSVAAPAALSTGGTVTFTINKIAAGGKGDVMVEVIVTGDAAQALNATVGFGEAPIAIHDSPAVHNPPLTVHAAQAPMPISPVATASGVQPHLALAGAVGSNTLISQPPIPNVGILRIIPQVVAAGSNFDMTWVIFNYGDADTNAAQLQFTQPPNTTFVQENHTNLYNGAFDILNHSGVALPGTPLVASWIVIPGHRAVAVTCTFTAGSAGTRIVDNDSCAAAVNGGLSHCTPDAVDVVPQGTPLPQGTNKNYTCTGRPLYCFSVNSTDVFIIGIGGIGDSTIVVEGPTATIVGGTPLTTLDGRSTNFGDPAQIAIGATTAAFLLANQANGAALATVKTSPVAVIVPQGCTFVAPSNAFVFAAGGGQLVSAGGGNLVSAGGGNLVSAGGGNLVSAGGGNIVSAGGGNLVSAGGGNIISAGGGNIVSAGGGNLVSAGGGNLVSAGGGNILSSTPSSLASYVTPGGGIVSAGGGNFGPAP